MRPCCSRRLATNFAVLMPMAKQSPCAPILVAVGVANGDCQLPDAELLRIAKFGCGNTRRINTDHGKISCGIVPDQVRRQLPAIWKRYLNTRCIVDDVTIGEHQAIRRENESRSAAVPLLCITIPGAARLSDFDLCD